MNGSGTAVEDIVRGLLREEGAADMDGILVRVYSTLVNHEMPGLESVVKVVNRICERSRDKELKRDMYVLKNMRPKKARSQPRLFKDEELSHDHIVLKLGEEATARGLDVHVGQSELLQLPLSGSKLGGVPARGGQGGVV